MSFQCECGDHVWAVLTKGLVTLVSPEDSHLLNVKWYSTNGRAQRSIRTGQGKISVLLAREIIGASAGTLVDHKNLNPLDNRRKNLRPCSMAENNRNVRQRRHSKQKYKGIHCYAPGRYRARIRKDGKAHYIGPFDTAEAAQAAYAAAAIQLHGEFARVS